MIAKAATPAFPPPSRIDDSALFIALFNSIGAGWFLKEMPVAALFIAAFVAGVSLMARRNPWARIASLVVGSAVVYALIAFPPDISIRNSARTYYPPVEDIERKYAAARDACEETNHPAPCGWRHALMHDMQAVRRATKKTEHVEEPDILRNLGIWVVATALLWILHKPVAESTSAPPIQLPPFLAPPSQENTEVEGLKQRDFDAWMALGGIIRHDTPEPSMRLQDVYARYLKWIGAQPGATSFDIDAFQKALKKATNKELIKVGSETVVPGMSFSNTSLI